jgi:hypothetical protein
MLSESSRHEFAQIVSTWHESPAKEDRTGGRIERRRFRWEEAFCGFGSALSEHLRE